MSYGVRYRTLGPKEVFRMFATALAARRQKLNKSSWFYAYAEVLLRFFLFNLFFHLFLPQPKLSKNKEIV